ncbi:hypothetical protein BH11BAC6_BH11BAC6_17890 [soil metagenome]
MREMFTDKNFIIHKIAWLIKLLLIISLVVFFAPLIILPFFNHPCADDYICGIHLRDLGFWQYQSFIYNNWGGRFAATFVGALFAEHNFLYDHYYLHSLLLLIINFIAVFFLLSVLNRHILKSDLVHKNLLLISFVFIALSLCSVAEPSTFLFWFSSVITYQLPVILIEFQVALWILLFNSDKQFPKLFAYLFLPLLVFTINGFNEVFIIVQGFLLVLLSIWRNRISKIFLAIVLMAFIASALLVLLSPGIQSRTAIIESKGIMTGIAAVIFNVTEVLWSICKNPLFWFVACIIFVYGNYAREKFEEWVLIKFLNIYKWLAPIVILLFLILSNGIAVTGLKGGVVPDRYVNAVIYTTVIILLMYIFIIGVSIDLKIAGLQMHLKWIIPGLLMIGLFANDFIQQSYKSLISAPLYNTVIKERETMLKKAAAENKPAVVNSYNNALQIQLQKTYTHSTKTLYDLVQQKPQLIFFEDDLATDYSIATLKDFYKVDSIIVK